MCDQYGKYRDHFVNFRSFPQDRLIFPIPRATGVSRYGWRLLNFKVPRSPARGSHTRSSLPVRSRKLLHLLNGFSIVKLGGFPHHAPQYITEQPCHVHLICGP